MQQPARVAPQLGVALSHKARHDVVELGAQP